MELPNRPIQHIVDTNGTALLTYLLPNDYIFRTIGERDYGIDGLIELAFGGYATGKFISVQLKSSQNFLWNQNNTVSISIPKRTCNYWLNNPMPVFLFISDLSLNKVFYVDAKKQLRERYDEFLNDENFIFYVPFINKLEKYQNIERCQTDGKYFVEVHKSEFILFYNIIDTLDKDALLPDLLEFIINWKSYFEHILHQQADPFLTQPLSFYQKTEFICSVINRFNALYHANLNQINLQEIKQKCKGAYKFWKNSVCDDEILEYEISSIHSEISNQIEPFIDSIKHLFFEPEKTYWLKTNPRLIQALQDINWNEYKLF